MIFESERFNITNISNVVYYSPKGSTYYNYPGNLPLYELMYYTSGETEVNFNNNIFKLIAGSMLYLPKDIEGANYSVKKIKDFSLYNVYFDTSEKLPDSPVNFNIKSEEIKALYEKIYYAWLAKRDGYYYKSVQSFYKIIELLHCYKINYNTDKKFAYLSSAEDYMTSHYCDVDFDYNKLLTLSGLSYSYYKSLFIGKYGMAPVKYVTHLKVKRACELLQTKKFTVSEVAKLCGYENIYYFSNVFKKIIGVSPKHYSNHFKK